MLFAIHALDAAEADRAKHYDAHKAHLKLTADYGVKLVIGGPLLHKDDGTAIGSLMIFEAADITRVAQYNDDDPFRRNGVWHTVHLAEFDRKT